ncbi:MAG: CRISPR-associated protein Cas4 [Oscillospiraceae bacterium]
MEYKEDDFLMLSGIQHFVFCRRQWALIHIEQLWDENLRTAEGEQMHEICHDKEFSESRKNILISRGMPVFSRSLGIRGECDVVEFIKDEDGITLNGRDGKYRAYPIEYKHGEPKGDFSDIYQLAAQAMCLEEMLMCKIKTGAIFYEKIKRRCEYEITDDIKDNVCNCFEQMHGYMQRGYIPKVKPLKRCNACSIKNLCIPKLYKLNDAHKYMDKIINGQDELL